MAIETRHNNFFPGQLIQNREMLNVNLTNQVDPNFTAYNPPHQMRFLTVPLPENNTDSGLTYNYNISGSRKRTRDHLSYPAPEIQSNFSQFAGDDDILPQLNQYQIEIDAIISQHTKKIRLELEERQKQQARMLAAALGDGVIRKLNEKDEQIQKMVKLNYSLQERVKSLYIENQLWRDLAQSNEATANTLRSNLEQVLLQFGDENISGAVPEEDTESCCGSSGHADKDERACRMCGEREACVLLLPCRHLCLCGVCGSGSHKVNVCPVCDCSMNATLHVNMSN